MYRPKLGLEPRVSRLAYEHSTTELSNPIRLWFKFRVISNYPRIGSCACGVASQTIGCRGGTGVAHVCRLLQTSRSSLVMTPVNNIR